MYSKKYSKLFTEGKIGNITIPNRIVMAPMGVGHYGDYFEDWLVDFYGERAKGGVGLVLTEGIPPFSRELDPYPVYGGVPRFDGIDKLSRAYDLANRVKLYGGVPGIQFTMGVGRLADAPMADNPTKTVSPMPAFANPEIMCLEMTKEDIKAKVDAIANGAVLAVMAGFQVIEIHAHVGYLIEQFLSKDLNQRTDEYGGSVENRFRVVDDIIKGIRAAVGDKVAVSFRMSVDQIAEGKMTLEEGLEYCALIEKSGYDALHIDAGTYEAVDWSCPSPYLGETPLKQFAAKVKKVVSIPVISVGAYLMPELAEEALEDGSADFIALGRPLLADPEWPEKARMDRADEIRGCIQCNELCIGKFFESKSVSCAVNPRCCKEKVLTIDKTEEPKRVTVVGAGPGGLVAALTAQKRGHVVKVLEKSDKLCGNMNLAGAEEFKQGVKNYSNYLRRQVELTGLDVEFNHEATIDSIKATDPDVVVMATGANPSAPPLPGIERDNVVDVRQLQEKVLSGNEKVVVLGGGFVGCETAMGLARAGHEVTIIEMLDAIATGLSMLNLPTVYRELYSNPKVKVLTGVKCTEIKDQTVIGVDKNGNTVEESYQKKHQDACHNHAYPDAFFVCNWPGRKRP